MIAIEVARHGGTITLAVIPQDVKNAQILMAEILAKCSGASVRIADISTLDGSYDLLINATPVGMYPKVDACAVSDTIIENSGSVFAAAVFASVKFVGDERHVFVRDAAAFVGEGDPDGVVSFCHGDVYICLSVFAGVVDEVFHKLCHSLFVGCDYG